MNSSWTLHSLGTTLLLASATSWAQAPAASAVASAQDHGLAGPAIEAPVAPGARLGDVGFGISGQTSDFSTDSLSDHLDGAAALVVGLGDPDRYAGLEVAMVSGALLKNRGSPDGFGEAGSLSFKLHTNFAGSLSLALGVSGAGRWGSESYKKATAPSTYAVATKYFPIGKYAAILNFGVGSNAFAKPEQGKVKSNGIGAIGSGAFYFSQRLSLIAEYTGRFVNAGVSVAPLRRFPLTLTLGAVNLGGSYGSHTGFSGTLGYGFTFN